MKTMRHLFLFMFIALLATSSYGQGQVKISSEKVKIDNKIYYLHRVGQGETVFSICLVYGVSQQELFKDNPDLANGLQAGQTLKIMDRSDPQTNQVLQESRQQKDEVKVDPTIKYKKHKLKKKDTMLSLAKKFDCTVEDIIAHNSDLIEIGLRKGQYINIPPKAKKVSRNDLATDSDYADEENVNCNAIRSVDEPLNIALLLPFQANSFNYNEKAKSTGKHYIEFYEGFLFAVDNLSRNGASINLSVYDVYDKSTMYNALSSYPLSEAHLIIGPVQANLMRDVVDFANEKRIPVVSPLDYKAEAFVQESKYFVQAPTSSTYQKDILNKYLCSESGNFLVVYQKDADTADFNTLLYDLRNCGKNVRTYNYVLLGSHNTELKNLLQQYEPNHVYVASADEVFVTDVLSKLNSLRTRSKMDITVYGTSRWKTSFSNLNIEHFYNLKAVIPQSYYIDYNRDDVKAFVQKYRDYYKGEPSRFSFQGFDLGTYFISKLSRYGRNLVPCVAFDSPTTLLQTRINLQKASPTGGLINYDSFLLKHQPDLEVIVD